MRRATILIILLISVSSLAGCQNQEAAGPIHSRAPSTAPTLSPAVQAVARIRPGDNVLNPEILGLILEMSAINRSQTAEQVVADEVRPFSDHIVNARDIEEFLVLGCKGPDYKTANHLTSLMPAATPLAATAASDAIALLTLRCDWAQRSLTDKATEYLIAVSNLVAGYIFSRPIPPSRAPATKRAPPPAGNADSFYKAVCAGGSAAISASSWYKAAEKGKGGWASIAIIAFAFTYCQDVLSTVMRG